MYNNSSITVEEKAHSNNRGGKRRVVRKNGVTDCTKEN
jgi:hypothetical protein